MNDKKELLLKLRAPFPVDKLSWRVGRKTNWDARTKKPINPKEKVKAMMLVYIDARDVQDRLDEVCNWSNTFTEVNGRIVCNLNIEGLGTRSDGAGDTDFEGEKGGLSDAFKRSAVMFGVGRYLYNAKNYTTWVNCTDMPDWDIYKNNKEQLDGVARQLGRDVTLYHYYLDMIDNCYDIEEFQELVVEARKKAKDELWSTGNLETFKTHVEKKTKELKEEK